MQHNTRSIREILRNTEVPGVASWLESVTKYSGPDKENGFSVRLGYDRYNDNVITALNQAGISVRMLKHYGDGFSFAIMSAEEIIEEAYNAWAALLTMAKAGALLESHDMTQDSAIMRGFEIEDLSTFFASDQVHSIVLEGADKFYAVPIDPSIMYREPIGPVGPEPIVTDLEQLTYYFMYTAERQNEWVISTIVDNDPEISGWFEVLCIKDAYPGHQKERRDVTEALVDAGDGTLFIVEITEGQEFHIEERETPRPHYGFWHGRYGSFVYIVYPEGPHRSEIECGLDQRWADEEWRVRTSWYSTSGDANTALQFLGAYQEMAGMAQNLQDLAYRLNADLPADPYAEE